MLDEVAEIPGPGCMIGKVGPNVGMGMLPVRVSLGAAWYCLEKQMVGRLLDPSAAGGVLIPQMLDQGLVVEPIGGAAAGARVGSAFEEVVGGGVEQPSNIYLGIGAAGSGQPGGQAGPQLIGR